MAIQISDQYGVQIFFASPGNVTAWAKTSFPIMPTVSPYFRDYVNPMEAITLPKIVPTPHIITPGNNQTITNQFTVVYP